MLFMMHCNFIRGVQHFQSTLLGDGGPLEGHKKQYTVYAFDNVDNLNDPNAIGRYLEE